MKNKFELEKEKLVRNLEKGELKQYINQLAKRYYVSFINNDSESHNSINNEIYDIISMFEDIYPSIKIYINYCLLMSANNMLQNSFQRDFPLRCPTNIDIDEKKSDVTINLLEKVKAKRKELKDLQNETKQDNR